jgi:sugar phosphate isomerase/epimerase
VTTHLKTEVQAFGRPPEQADVKRIVRILADTGYRGYLTLEYEGRQPVEQAAPRALAAIRDAVAALV